MVMFVGRDMDYSQPDHDHRHLKYGFACTVVTNTVFIARVLRFDRRDSRYLIS